MCIDGFYILSYPRSGNSWVRYIIEWISGGISVGDENFVCDTSLRKDIKNFNVITNDIVARKRHSLCPLDDRTHGLIFLIRDYHESLVRHAEHKSRYDKELNHSISVDKGSYIDLLFDFDMWPEDRRCLVYYEDLIENAELEIFRILLFMRMIPDYLPEMTEFFRNIQHHRLQSIDTYTKTTSTSQTSGTMVDFHKFKLTKQERIEWDHKLQTNFPELYFKYLMRYKTIKTDCLT